MLILELNRSIPVHTLAFSPDGQRLASVSDRSPEIILWDLNQRKEERRLSRHTHRVVAVAFSPCGDYFATASSIGEIHLWSLNPLELERQFTWQPETTFVPIHLLFTADGRWLVSTIRPIPATPRRRYIPQYLGQIMALDFPKRKEVRLQTAHRETISCLAQSPDGKWLATGSFDRSVHIMPLVGNSTPMILPQGKKVHYIAFSPDGQTLAAGTPSGLVKIWDATTGHKRVNLKGQAKPLHSLTYSPDGSRLATAGGEGMITFWNVQTGTSRVALDWDIGVVHAVAFAPDGMRAAAGGNGKVVVWDIDDWEGI